VSTQLVTPFGYVLGSDMTLPSRAPAPPDGRR
jgi:hypothetical protein